MEKLVSELQRSVSVPNGRSVEQSPSVSPLSSSDGVSSGGFVAQDFWTMLSDEMIGLREAICGSDVVESRRRGQEHC